MRIPALHLVNMDEVAIMGVQVVPMVRTRIILQEDNVEVISTRIRATMVNADSMMIAVATVVILIPIPIVALTTDSATVTVAKAIARTLLVPLRLLVSTTALTGPCPSSTAALVPTLSPCLSTGAPMRTVSSQLSSTLA